MQQGGSDQSYSDTSKEGEATRLELNFHANMPVVCRQEYIMAESGKSINVNSFAPDEAVFKNALILDSSLKKKHTSICYHWCREAIASHTVWVAKEGMLTN